MSKLKFVNFKDFKDKWGLESKFTIDSLEYYFNFFRDSVIELEDDSLISKYTIHTQTHREIIYKNEVDIKAKLQNVYNAIHTGVFGNSYGRIIIHTSIFLPSSQFSDITLITERVIECVKFLKDNGVDLGFECNLKTNSPEGLKIEIIKNIENV